MNYRQFYSTLKEAYGLEAPAMGCLFIEELGDRLIYDCWLIDHDIKISVPFPKRVIQLALAEAGRDINDYRTERVKVGEVFLYALAKFEKQPGAVKAHLQQRFGYLFHQCVEFARKEWKKTEDFDTRSWAGLS